MNRNVIRVLWALYLIFCIAGSGLILRDHVDAYSLAELTRFKDHSQVIALLGILIMGSVCVLYVAMAYYEHQFKQQRASSLGILKSVILTAFCCCGTVGFILLVPDFHHILVESLGQRDFFAMYGPVILAKCLLAVLRKLALTDAMSKTPILMLSFVLNVYASSSVRKRVIDIADDELTLVFVSSLTLGLMEVGARVLITLLYMANTALYLQRRMLRLHQQTLGELVDVCRRLEERQQVMYGMILVDQLAEIFVIIALTTSDLAHPVWSQFRTWVQLSDFVGRVPTVLYTFVIQFLVEILTDWSCMWWSLSLVPFDLVKSFRLIICRGAFVSPHTHVPASDDVHATCKVLC